jgi:hypothetical protein
MKMIRHDDENIQSDSGTDRLRSKPLIFNDFAENALNNLTIHYFAEQTLAPVGDYRHKIRPLLRVIVRRQADRPAAVLTVRHVTRSWRPSGDCGERKESARYRDEGWYRPWRTATRDRNEGGLVHHTRRIGPCRA